MLIPYTIILKNNKIKENLPRYINTTFYVRDVIYKPNCRLIIDRIIKNFKPSEMKTNSTQQEILLMTGTSFSTRQWCPRDEAKETNYSEIEKLEDACWNGLLQEMLPEICEQNDKAKKLFLWQVKEGKSFIELELGEIPEAVEKEFSIDPYSFLHLQSLS